MSIHFSPSRARLDDTALAALFHDGRTIGAWQNREIADAVLRELYALVSLGPTSGNCQPIRLVFVRSADAKEKLRPALSKGNLDKTMAAPVTAIIGHDLSFYEHLPRLFPHTDARSWFVGNPALIEETALRNGSLAGAYLILAARALGLDAGPMSGFDKAKVDHAFFEGTTIRSNFLCNLGYGDRSSLKPRLPRLSFDEAARIM